MEVAEDEQCVQDVEALKTFKKILRRMRNNVIVLEECTTDHKQGGIIDSKGFLTRCIKLESLRNRMGEANVIINECQKVLRVSGFEQMEPDTPRSVPSNTSFVEDTETSMSEFADEDEQSDFLTSPRNEIGEDTPTNDQSPDWVLVKQPLTSDSLDDNNTPECDGTIEVEELEPTTPLAKKKPVGKLKWLLAAFIGQSTSNHD
jgi:hypothetical protein